MAHLSANANDFHINEYIRTPLSIILLSDTVLFIPCPKQYLISDDSTLLMQIKGRKTWLDFLIRKCQNASTGSINQYVIMVLCLANAMLGGFLTDGSSDQWIFVSYPKRELCERSRGVLISCDSPSVHPGKLP